ncbi:MAG TPA: DUF4383 domain-containing protein [Acidimicrobiales bacterium]|nr:DUF4383 domain-containing protein [Acidimicrobiales bacterium]
MAQANRAGRSFDVGNATTIQRAAALVGAVFLLVGIAGFIPGITTNFDDLTFAGTDSRAELLGLFQVSVLHNLVHLAFGVLGLVASRTVPASRLYLIGGGVVYLLLTLYGAVIDLADDANFVPFNTADNWLHLVLGVGMIALGVALTDRRAVRRTV